MDDTATTTDAPAGPTDVRRAAIVVGAGGAALELVALLWTLVTVPAELPVWSALLGVVRSAVPIAGVVLLRRGDERGVGVLVVIGAWSLPSVLGGGWPLGPGPRGYQLWLLASLALVAAGVLAWRSRDRPRWSGVERAHDPVFLAAAVGVVIATIVPTTAFEVAPIGMDPWWQPALWRSSGDSVWETAAFVLVPVVLAALLWLASRAAHPVAGAVLGALAVTGLAGALFNLVQATVSAEFRLTPVGWLDLAANTVLLVVAARWWTARETLADGS